MNTRDKDEFPSTNGKSKARKVRGSRKSDDTMKFLKKERIKKEAKHRIGQKTHPTMQKGPNQLKTPAEG